GARRGLRCGLPSRRQPAPGCATTSARPPWRSRRPKPGTGKGSLEKGIGAFDAYYRSWTMKLMPYTAESPPFVFGGLEPQRSGFDNSKALIWPVPFEKTVSYGRGTREGPAAIIDASRYMELYDEEIDGEPASI